MDRDILKHLPLSTATAQGHLHQERQNLQTTSREKLEAIKQRFTQLKAKQNPGQSLSDVLKAELDTDSFPLSPAPNTRTNDVAYMIIDKDEVCTSYTDLTG